MAEQFLTLMADLDEESQAFMGEWSEQLKKAGFIGTQTPGLPFHISLETRNFFRFMKQFVSNPVKNPHGRLMLRF